MADLSVKWGVGDFKKWGDACNVGDDFEMGGGGVIALLKYIR